MPRDTERRQGRQGHVILETPIQFVKGVGERRAELLRRLGINAAGDLLYHVPHRYEDATTITPMNRVDVGADVTVMGTVVSKGVVPTRKGLRIFQAVLQDASGLLELSWPGQPFLDRTINKGDTILASGPCRFYHGRQLQPREFVNLGAEVDAEGGRVLAVYAATEGITARQIRGLINQHIDVLLSQVDEFLSASQRDEVGVLPLQDALRRVHQPASLEDAELGRRRLAFDEFFFVHLLHRRANALARTPRRGIQFATSGELVRTLFRSLPFQLTAAQERVLAEITVDMTSASRMHRLLQGDVGSGKTVVALGAALLAIENGYQVAFMVPTELLAEQHVRSIGRMLEPLGIAPVLVTGSLGAAERRAVDARMQSEEPLLIIGTHALVQQRTSMAKLGLVVIDEQHRFGVEQRAALGAKGETPDVLLMSATPIPRSLALTIYGDLDVSTLDERPPGRRPITTARRPNSARDRVMEFIDREIEAGRQAYIVYPVIEESEKTDLKAATTMREELAAGPFASRSVELLHGKVPNAERDAIMTRFRDGAIDVLVATTVIEVGIDVPNATIMLVEHPERFGLSQLHQLRGRVGRGAEASYCILLGHVGPDAAARLDVFVGTEDGFAIAAADLKLRGMGDLFGQQQSGEAMFRVADPIKDAALSGKARALAVEVLQADPQLAHAHHAQLRKVLRARFSRALTLFRVG